MDELKDSFERLVYQVGEVVLHLLGALDIHEFQSQVGQEVQVIFIDFLTLVGLFYFETHVPADSPYPLVALHVVIHFVESLLVRP